MTVEYVLSAIGSNILLFCLVFGMSATVDIGHMKKQVRNKTALLIGVSLQFVILPFIGFVIVKLLNMDTALGVMLLVITSSPGGSYSNWWCSLFNAELALSVTMTAVSTLLSTFMLPVNLIIYTTSTYSSAVVKSLDWWGMFVALIVVIGGISSGLLCSAFYSSHRFNLLANKMGNFAGISLIIFSSVVSSSSHDASLFDQDAKFYIGVALPCLFGVTVATILATKFKLEKPERVAVAVEGCYQNTGIATSVAISMFSGDELARAIGVPLYYGIVEAIVLAFFCLGCWKIGWTKAPPNENVCTVILTSYEVEKARLESPSAIEVVYGNDPTKEDGQEIDDLVFTQTVDGYKVDEDSLHERPNSELTAANGAVSLSKGTAQPASPSDKDPSFGGGLSSLKHRATGYRQGVQSPDTPSHNSSPGVPDDDDVPAAGKALD